MRAHRPRMVLPSSCSPDAKRWRRRSADDSLRKGALEERFLRKLRSLYHTPKSRRVHSMRDEGTGPARSPRGHSARKQEKGATEERRCAQIKRSWPRHPCVQHPPIPGAPYKKLSNSEGEPMMKSGIVASSLSVCGRPRSEEH